MENNVNCKLIEMLIESLLGQTKNPGSGFPQGECEEESKKVIGEGEQLGVVSCGIPPSNSH